MDLALWCNLSYDDSVHNHHFRTVIFLLLHSYYPVRLMWNVITMSCSSTCYYHGLQSLFSVTYCSSDNGFVRRVGLQVIVLSLRWCCISDLRRLCYSDTVLIILDDDLLMTWWFLLLLPIMDYEYLSCQLCRWFLDDVVVMSFLRCCCWCCLPSPFRPATFLSSRWWSAVYVRQSSFLLMNISYADDGSLVSSPWWPSELDKQFVSDKWTLVDDDDPDDSSLPDLTWLCILLLCILYYCLRTSSPSVCLSPSALPHCGCLCIYSHIFSCIYSAFILYLLTNQHALVHLQLLLESLIHSNPCQSDCFEHT